MTKQETEDATVTDPTGTIAALLAEKPARYTLHEWLVKVFLLARHVTSDGRDVDERDPQENKIPIGRHLRIL